MPERTEIFTQYRFISYFLERTSRCDRMLRNIWADLHDREVSLSADPRGRQGHVVMLGPHNNVARGRHDPKEHRPAQPPLKRRRASARGTQPQPVAPRGESDSHGQGSCAVPFRLNLQNVFVQEHGISSPRLILLVSTSSPMLWRIAFSARNV